MKNLPAPEYCRNAPKIVNRMISDDDTSTGDAEDAFQRHVEMADEAADVVALVRPRRAAGTGRTSA